MGASLRRGRRRASRFGGAIAFPSDTAHHVAVVTHAGHVVAFTSATRDDGTTGIGYSVLSPAVGNPDQDASWSDVAFLDFPRELRPVGRSVITVDFGDEPVPVADAPFTVVSDDRYVYVFRQSLTGSLYFDRFVLDEVTGRLVTAWEVRFRRSRKPDLPADARDTFGSTDMDDRRFVAPTLDLDFVTTAADGRFTALVVPTELAGVDRWLLVVANGGTDALDCWSLLRADDGSFDLTDSIDDDGAVVADRSIVLLHDGAPLTAAAGPAATLYHQQEWLRGDQGRLDLQRLDARVMVALPTGPDGVVAVVDLAVGRDGRLAAVADELPVAPLPPVGTALELIPSAGTQVTLPVPPSPGTSGTVEVWLAPEAPGAGVAAVVQSAADVDVPLLLALDDGRPVVQVGSGAAVRAAAADRAVEPRRWVHLAAAWTDDDVTLVVDGRPVPGGADPVVAPAPPDAGYRVGGPDGVAGLVDTLRLWRTARTADEILAWMSTPVTPTSPGWADLAGCWPMDEPADDTRTTTVPNVSAAGAQADGVLQGARWVPTSAPTDRSLTPLAWDANGLTVTGGLLPSVTTTAAPVLVEGVDARLHLYVAEAGTDALLAAHCSVVVARAAHLLTWRADDPDDPEAGQTGTVTLVARQPGTVMNAVATAPELLTVAVTAPAAGTVTLRAPDGYTEVWPQVPLELTAFTAVLNGTAAQLTDDPAQGADDATVYDYTTVVVTPGGGQRGPAPAAGLGSALYRVLPADGADNGFPAVVEAATAPAATLRVGADPWWQAAPPYLVADLSDLGQYVEVLDGAGADAYDGPLAAERDVAVEAWLRPVPNELDEDLTVMVLHRTDGPRYLVGVDTAGYPYAVYGQVAGRASTPIPTDGTWTHVAASYRTDFGLELGGARYLDAGNNRSLDSSDAVTVEAWTRLDEGGVEQTVASKWDPDRGRCWRLLVDAGNRVAFEVVQAVATGTLVRRATGTTALTPGQWHHVAGVYDVAFERTVALTFDVGCYVTVPELGTMPSEGVTVAAWIRLLGGDRSGNQTLMMSTDPLSALPFALSLQDGRPSFQVWADDGAHAVESSVPLRADDWLHVAGSYDPVRGIALVVDGVPVPVAPAGPLADVPRPQAAVEAAFTVGGTGSSQSFVGTMTELSLWTRGLTLEEVRQKIQQPLAAGERGLAGYWRFNDLYGTTAMDLAGTANGQIVGAEFVRLDKGAFAHKVLVDGVVEAFDRVVDPLVTGDAPVRLGSAAFTDYLQGALGETRLWSAGRMNWQIDQFAREDVEVNAKGLVALWSFETGSGRVAFDGKGDNNAVIRDGVIALTDQAVDAMWVTTTFRAGWSFVVGGAAVATVPAVPPAGGFGGPQVSIGAVTRTSGALVRQFTGEIQELRVWARQLTAGEVRDRMTVQLDGPAPGLAGRWPFDDGSGAVVVDRSGWGAHGRWQGDGDGPAWRLSGVPLADETPQVRSVPGRTPLPANARGRWACGAGRFAQLQARLRAEPAAVLRRAYAYVDAATSELVLLSEPAAGDLVRQFVGQAQSEPTLLGYIEGPPPLPAENLKVFPGDPMAYLGAATLQLDETGTRTFTYLGSRDLGTDSNVSAQLGFTVDSETQAGIGVQQKVFGLNFSLGLQVSAQETLSALAEATVAEELATVSRRAVEVRGRWVPNTYAVDGGRGDLFYPTNVGYALVRSGTADVFALRLRDSGGLVGYAVTPDPDVPEDVNVISFPLREGYVKNGTLDGWIGYEPDTSYRYLQPGHRGSYFKPLEAYALKQATERQTQRRATYFENVDVTGLGRRDKAMQPGSVDLASPDQDLANALAGIADRTALSSEAWKARMARRDLVNTYVWTADGGLYAEQQQFLAVREQSTGGAYTMTALAGVYAEMSMNVGPSYALNGMFGTHVATYAMKTDREAWQYAMDVTCPGERYIGLVVDEDGELVYTGDPSPGKVRGYRFMSFLLAPSQRNFEDLSLVVDEDWLEGQGRWAGRYEPDALALRQALTRPNEVWRVLHRVTYVSRVPPSAQSGAESLAPPVRRPDQPSIVQNAWLIAELPTDLQLPQPLAVIGVEADVLLDELARNPVWGPRLAADRAAVKRDVMAYLATYYGIATT